MGVECVYVPEIVNATGYGPGIFLAGPTPRREEVPSWRPGAVEILANLGFEGRVYIPEARGGGWCGDWTRQVEWEDEALNWALVILFWVPRSIPDMMGLTTNDEFGYWKGREPEKLVFGNPVGAPHTGYQRYYCRKLGIPAFDSLEDTARAAIDKCGEIWTEMQMESPV